MSELPKGSRWRVGFVILWTVAIGLVLFVSAIVVPAEKEALDRIKAQPPGYSDFFFRVCALIHRGWAFAIVIWAAVVVLTQSGKFDRWIMKLMIVLLGILLCGIWLFYFWFMKPLGIGQ